MKKPSFFWFLCGLIILLSVQKCSEPKKPISKTLETQEKVVDYKNEK